MKMLQHHNLAAVLCAVLLSSCAHYLERLERNLGIRGAGPPSSRTVSDDAKPEAGAQAASAPAPGSVQRAFAVSDEHTSGVAEPSAEPRPPGREQLLPSMGIAFEMPAGFVLQPRADGLYNVQSPSEPGFIALDLQHGVTLERLKRELAAPLTLSPSVVLAPRGAPRSAGNTVSQSFSAVTAEGAVAALIVATVRGSDASVISAVMPAARAAAFEALVEAIDASIRPLRDSEREAAPSPLDARLRGRVLRYLHTRNGA